MNELKSPTSLVLFPATSPLIHTLCAKLRERFRFVDTSQQIPSEIANAITVTIKSGAVECFTDHQVKQLTWQDPHGKQDLVLVCSEGNEANVSAIRDLLSFGVPIQSRQIVSVIAQPNTELETGCRVSVACARSKDIGNLNPRIETYRGDKVFGPGAILLGLAKELDLKAFCIVIEYSPRDNFANSNAINMAVIALARLTMIGNNHGNMSEETIEIHKQIKNLAQKRNEESQAKQAGADYVWWDPAANFEQPENWNSPESVESELRDQENLAWIEQLFEQVSTGPTGFDRERAEFLKSELDRLGLYDQFENRFLDLFQAGK